MIRLAILLSIAFTILSGNKAHEFHVSITEIEYVEEKQEVQIISRIFIDDLETMLRKRLNDNIILDYGRDETAIDNYLTQYVKDKLIVRVDNKVQEIGFLGKEYKSESVHIYALIKDATPFTTISVTNEMLFESFDDQQNIIKLKTASSIQNFPLTRSNRSHMFSLD